MRTLLLAALIAAPAVGMAQDEERIIAADIATDDARNGAECASVQCATMRGMGWSAHRCSAQRCAMVGGGGASAQLA